MRLEHAVRLLKKQPRASITQVATQSGEVVTYELTANAGQAPQKICTHIGPLWPDEYVRIDRAYPNLVDQILTNND